MSLLQLTISNRVNFHTLVSVPRAGPEGVLFTLWPEQHWLYRYHGGASSLGNVPRAASSALVNVSTNTSSMPDQRMASRGHDAYEREHHHHDYHHHFPDVVRSVFGGEGGGGPQGSRMKDNNNDYGNNNNNNNNDDDNNDKLKTKVPLAHLERAQKYEITVFQGDAIFIPSGFSYAWTAATGKNDTSIAIPPLVMRHSYVDASNVAAVREELAHEALLSPIYLEVLHALQVLEVRELKTPREPPRFLSWAAYRGEESVDAAKARATKSKGVKRKPRGRRSHRSWKIDKAWDSFVLSLALPAPVGVTVSDVGRRRAKVCWSLP